jgi:hypothetical protein
MVSSEEYMCNWRKILAAALLGKAGAAIACAVHALVPSGNPPNSIDGAAVGTFGGTVAVGLVTTVLHRVEPVVSCERRNFAVAIALLLLGFPVPQFFPNAHADRTYTALEQAVVCNHFSSRGSVNSTRRNRY